MIPGKILIALVVAALVGGAYYFGYDHGWEKSVKNTPESSVSPQIDETANWKTYTDPKNTYTIKYPNSLYSKPGDQANPNFIEFTRIQVPNETYDPAILGYSISVNVFPSEGKSYEDHMDFRLKDQVIQTPITVSGVDGYKIINGGFDWPTDAVRLIKNDQLYQIDIKYYDEEKDESVEQEGRKIFEQMVSTFKYI